MIKNQKVEEFLDDLASKSAAPGGGSVAALTGAIAAGLVSMVCRLTKGKEMNVVLKKSEKLRKELLELAEQDKKAFLNVIKEKYSEASLKRAAAVPAKTARLADEVLKLAKIAAKKVNKKAITDAKIAVDLAKTAQRGAILNVEANKK